MGGSSAWLLGGNQKNQKNYRKTLFFAKKIGFPIVFFVFFEVSRFPEQKITKTNKKNYRKTNIFDENIGSSIGFFVFFVIF